MMTLSRWLEGYPSEAEGKALDYLNGKGFYCSNSNLSAKKQIEEIEKKNSQSLHFKDSVRKLKNNLRQHKSTLKTPYIKSRTFKLSDRSHEALKAIAKSRNVAISNVLEKIIEEEAQREGLLQNVNYYNYSGSHGMNSTMLNNLTNTDETLATHEPSQHYPDYGYSMKYHGLGDKLEALINGSDLSNNK
ncbi:hypothetical protein IEI94_13990 [Halomonas sp. ML-15]|uniref:hypothetical protein n=1 Tax=Halomonas sp. ML-15 TaxID=2773305 RepID=UPI0017479505|nr:hypothetical protein [Halomonas sp. ML-15]MBD3896963.1 hypothetical protein [Halomonas sp. ML-15]